MVGTGIYYIYVDSHVAYTMLQCSSGGPQQNNWVYKLLIGVFRKSDPGNNLILRLESDPEI